MKRPKISIIAGSLNSTTFLNYFTQLFDDFEVEACILESPELLHLQSACIPIKIFPQVKDMPGYIRGLNEHLANSDVIIGLESWQLSTFQALRVARNEGRPFIVVSNEIVPFRFNAHKNIRAIEHDILLHADMFVATSPLAQKSLAAQGVSLDKILTHPFSPHQILSKFQQKRRNYFRSYIKMHDSHVALLFKKEMNDIKCHENILHSLLMLKADTTVKTDNLRIIFAGQGEHARKLKEMCCDLGLSQHILFLHQEVSEFWDDLLSAVDGWIELESSNNSPTANYQYVETFEAVNSGVIPLIQSGMISGEAYPENHQIRFANTNPILFSGVIREFLLRHQAESREFRLAKLANIQASYYPSRDLSNQVLKLLANRSSEQSPLQKIDDDMGKVQNYLDENKLSDASVLVEELVLRSETHPSRKWKAFELKGELHFRRQEHEEAVRCFDHVLQHQVAHVKANRFLGFISFSNQSYEEAIAFFRRALSNAPNDSESHLGLGMVYAKLEIQRDAVAWLHKAAMDPKVSKRAALAILPLVEKIEDKRICLKILEAFSEALPAFGPLELAIKKFSTSDGSTKRTA